MVHVDWVYRQFGQRLREARTQQRLSQAYVAAYVGLSRTSITNIERGRQRIPLHLLYLLAEAVRTDPASLLPAAAAEDKVPSRDLEGLEEPLKEWVTRIVGEAEPSATGGARR